MVLHPANYTRVDRAESAHRITAPAIPLGGPGRSDLGVPGLASRSQSCEGVLVGGSQPARRDCEPAEHSNRIVRPQRAGQVCTPTERSKSGTLSGFRPARRGRQRSRLVTLLDGVYMNFHANFHGPVEHGRHGLRPGPSGGYGWASRWPRSS